jgi:hypothetical protein
MLPDYSDRHPPYLTKTERPRFIRAYYRIWSIMLLEVNSRPQRLSTLTLRQLHRTVEMAQLPAPLGDEIGPDFKYQPGELYDIPRERSEYFSVMLDFSREMHKRVHPLPIRISPDFQQVAHEGEINHEGHRGFVTLFDHFQMSFKNLLAGGVMKTYPLEYAELMRNVIWGESEDERESPPKWVRI